MNISDFLRPGKESAIRGTQLIQFMGLKSLRDLTQQIERERCFGYPICASNNSDSPGYYLANDPAELESYIKSLDRRLAHVTRTRQHLESTLLTMTGQGKIGGC